MGCYDLDSDKPLTDTGAIAALIRSKPDTPRRIKLEHATLSELRKKVEKQLTAEFLRPLQAPLGVAPVLNAGWS